jgi:alkylation response protein AidB-like acyl-CoA dehydrogenase
MPHAATISDTHAQQLAALAANADGSPAWPESSWNILRQSGALRWVIPKEYGGDGLEAIELLHGYEQLAASCLTTCFLLSQREAACRRLIDSDCDDLCRELLPALASSQAFATVGLSQLTTSRQHTAPSLRVRETPNALIFDGTIPWVTGAARAQHIIIGATLDDGRQVLAVLPTDLSGVSIDAPFELMALKGSITAEVICKNVTVDKHWLLAGPAQRIMRGGRGGTGALETSCLAIGLTGAALRFLETEAQARPELVSSTDSLRRQHQELRQNMLRLATCGGTPDDTFDLRSNANTLVLSTTQAALTAAKGTGFLLDHPAQLWARQALFFLVWSCPWPAAAATLAHLSAPVCA